MNKHSFTHSIVFQLGMIVACVVYPIFRYVVFGDVAPAQIPVYVLNKSFCLYASFAILLYAIDLRAERIASATLHLNKTLLSTFIHVGLSLCIFGPLYFKKFYIADGKMTHWGEIAILSGVLATVFYWRSYCNSACLQFLRLRLEWGVMLVCVHLAAIGWKGWLTPEKWQGGLPPITLICIIPSAIAAWMLFSASAKRSMARVALVLIVVGVGGVGCKDQSESKVRIFCGSSMANPVQEFVAALDNSDKERILLDFGGSETLLPRILAGGECDVFICHDPFEEKLKSERLAGRSFSVGVLKPVLIVSKGNPLNIRSIEDLQKNGIRLGIGNPRYSTCGELFVAKLNKQGIAEAVLKNVLMEARTHSELANGVKVGSLDAAVVWNFAARLEPHAIESVSLGDDFPSIRVTFVGMEKSSNPSGRDWFLRLCEQKHIAKTFKAHGYE